MNNDKTDRRELLGQSCGLLTHPLNEAPIVEAPSRHVRVKFFQGVGESSILPILKKGITVHSLRVNIIYTICIGYRISTINSSLLKGTGEVLYKDTEYQLQICIGYRISTTNPSLLKGTGENPLQETTI